MTESKPARSTSVESVSKGKGSDKHTAKNEMAFSAQELLELIKSLPASTSQNQNHFSMSTNVVPEFDPSNKE